MGKKLARAGGLISGNALVNLPTFYIATNRAYRILKRFILPDFVNSVSLN